MKLTEKQFKKLTVLAGIRNGKNLLILAHRKNIFYLGHRDRKNPNGFECRSFPTLELAHKAFLSVTSQLYNLPSSVDTPDLFRSQITLEEATAGFKKTLNDTGKSTCPCCEDHSVIYRRRIPVHGLTLLAIMVHRNVKWRNGKVDDSFEIPYMHIKDLPRHLVRSRSLGKVAKWGLVESMDNTDLKKKTSGLWKPTVIGANFTRGYFPIRSHVILYRNKFLRYEGKLVYFNDVVKRFDYNELMNEIGGLHKELNEV